nr:hypothetical protein [Tanacetum cinerariifolium]
KADLPRDYEYVASVLNKANDMHAGEVLPEYDRSGDGYTRCGAS